MKFKVQVGGSLAKTPVSGSLRFADPCRFPTDYLAVWLGLTPMGFKWAFSCPRFWSISGCFQCGQMGKVFPFKGTAWPAAFPTSSPVPGQQGMSWEGKKDAGGDDLVSPPRKEIPQVRKEELEGPADGGQQTNRLRTRTTARFEATSRGRGARCGSGDGLRGLGGPGIASQ